MTDNKPTDGLCKKCGQRLGLHTIVAFDQPLHCPAALAARPDTVGDDGCGHQPQAELIKEVAEKIEEKLKEIFPDAGLLEDIQTLRAMLDGETGYE
jgi:hypothetical protein